MSAAPNLLTLALAGLAIAACASPASDRPPDAAVDSTGESTGEIAAASDATAGALVSPPLAPERAMELLRYELPGAMPRPPSVVPPRPLPRLPTSPAPAPAAAPLVGVAHVPSSARGVEPVPPLATDVPATGGADGDVARTAIPPGIGGPAIDDIGDGVIALNGCNIIGTDGRTIVGGTTVYPWTTIAKLRVRFGNAWYGCSAAIVRRNFALTAGHCIYDDVTDDWADEVIVIPGLSGTTQPFGMTYADHLYSVTGWTVSHDFRYDIGIVRLANAIGTTTGTLGYGAFADTDLAAWSLNTAGYPFDFNDQMIRAFAPTHNVMANQLCTELDVCSGQSGSGAWVLTGADRYVTGVVSHMFGACGAYNSLTRITSALFNWMQGVYGECSCTAGACCDGCSYRPGGTLCRAAAGSCDVAETCSGLSAACPADALRGPTVECRPAAGPCDVAESCSGASATCPADALRGPTVECRAAAGPCDVAESCSGASATCPADALRGPTVECRAAAGPCDVAESCTGASPSCPADALRDPGVECRPAAGDCDLAERCSGGAPACPPDVRRDSTYLCRAAGGPCDLEERCAGGVACPTDAFLDGTRECRPAAGDCDVGERCSGDAATCPPDRLRTAGEVCRPTDGACDAAEACTGASPTCPPDLPVSDDTCGGGDDDDGATTPSGCGCDGGAGAGSRALWPLGFAAFLMLRRRGRRGSAVRGPRAPDGRAIAALCVLVAMAGCQDDGDDEAACSCSVEARCGTTSLPYATFTASASSGADACAGAIAKCNGWWRCEVVDGQDCESATGFDCSTNGACAGGCISGSRTPCVIVGDGPSCR